VERGVGGLTERTWFVFKTGDCLSAFRPMRIVCLFRDIEKVWETYETEVVFGRSSVTLPIILDLSPDQRVSRMHGRIWEENGLCWVEDLDSSRGTLLNGVEIKGRGKQQVQPTDTILVGQTVLRVACDESQVLTQKTNYLDGTFLLPEAHFAEAGVAVANDVDATAFEPVALEGAKDEAARRLKFICDLPFQFATKITLGALLPAIINQLIEVIPRGESWALVLRDPETDALLLKAHRYVQHTYLSETILRRAIAERKAFVWRRTAELEMTASMAQSGIETGMYAPLLWQGEALGAIFAGTRNAQTVFSDEDLELLVAVGQYAAMAIATIRLREQLSRESTIKTNLLHQFAPKVANHLSKQRGSLALGGRRTEVSIVSCHMRGFPELAQGMAANEVVQMVNEYLDALEAVIFAHNATVGKFLGHGIWAVFGVPESDPHHHENALRAGVAMQGAVTAVSEARRLRGVPYGSFGIGIHCDEVVHGFAATSNRTEFTVVGDAVNRTARYCSAAGAGQLLLSPQMHEHVWRFVETEQSTMSTDEGEQLVAVVVHALREIRGAAKGAAPSADT